MGKIQNYLFFNPGRLRSGIQHVLLNLSLRSLTEIQFILNYIVHQSRDQCVSALNGIWKLFAAALRFLIPFTWQKSTSNKITDTLAETTTCFWL